jgi:hypothetical protein
MKRRRYSPALLIALRKALRRVAESGHLASGDPAIRNLKTLLVLNFAEQEIIEAQKRTTKD